MIFGPDALGGMHYERALLKSLWMGDCCGIMLTTFGKAHKTTKRLGLCEKLSDLAVHLAPFDYSHKYPVKQHLKQLRKDAKWLEELAQDTNTEILLSPFCEHNHPRKVMAPLFDELRAIAPSCLMLNSIWKGEQVPGTITEIHLPNSKLVKKPSGQYTVAFDGFGGDGNGDFPDADVPAILSHYSDARHIRCWNFRYNGKCNHEDQTPVSRRKFWPTQAYLEGHRHTMKAREGSISWPENALYKPFADDHGGGPNSKDNKAMCILPLRAESVSVFNSVGHKIDTMTRYPGDHKLGARYYSNLYAYQIADKAAEGTGSRRIRIANMPLTDGDLRSGLFR